jgi:hypothetical protein
MVSKPPFCSVRFTSRGRDQPAKMKLVRKFTSSITTQFWVSLKSYAKNLKWRQDHHS